MKFSQMPYERPDLEGMKQTLSGLVERLKGAASYEEAKAVFLEKEQELKHIDTQATLASVRHSIDTRDQFYDGEETFWNSAFPQLQEYMQAWTAAMLASPFRKDFEAEYGDLLFVNAEIQLKTFSPEIIPQLQQENDLTTEYEKLLASAQIPFEGKTYTLSQLTPFKTDADDERRLAAWKAEGQWYKDHQGDLDRIYDQLTHLRDAMGKKLGYEGYTTLGYYRMGRNCYTKEDVEKFRAAVVKYLVPVADRIYREQAKRLGKQYPMSFADNALEFRSGNPRPQGTPDDILAQGKKFYDELSPETSEFFQTMLDNELLDVLSTEGKRSGGYCTSIPDYRVPFIFANFNGTQGDVEVVTHEAGHAFAAYRAMRSGCLSALEQPTMEGCETHSMSMEFLTSPWHEKFFGPLTRKYEVGHCEDSLIFIPYGCMVDEFQHLMYENPDLTPAQRNETWLKLEKKYRPWIDFEDLPFYGRGAGWQRQLHIYLYPLYYIDYCMAQTMAFQFWMASMENREDAWKRYLAFVDIAGTKTFEEAAQAVGMKLPYAPGCIKEIGEAISKWIDANPI